MGTVQARWYHGRGDHGGDSETKGDSMAKQEQDFNKETNRQSTLLFIKDSEGVTIDLTEVQCAQVLQSLLTLSDLQGRLKSSAQWAERGPNLLRHLLRLPVGEMQDIEVNSLLQGQSIHIENCTDVRISVRQVEVEKVVEFGLAVVRLLEHQVGGKAPAGDGAGTMA
jgi:Spore Coat Protein X and V domain